MTSSSWRDILAAATREHREGRFGDAIRSYEALVGQGQGTPEILLRLASALRSDGRIDEALALYDGVEQTAGHQADFWFNRGNALADLGRHSEADSCLARALEIEPHNAVFLANRGLLLARLADEGGAISSYRQALAIDPAQKLAAHNLANLLAERGELVAATALLRQTLEHWPDLAEAQYNLALVLLRRGDYAAGAAAYEWRWQVPGFGVRPLYRDVPVWDGRPFPGRRLVVHAEQGLGDTIQFAMLLPLAKSLGGDVVLHVPERLAALLQALPFDVEVTAHHPASSADFQIPLMSLIHRLKLTPGAISARRFCLAIPEERVARWAGRMELGRGSRSVGFVWQGNPASPVEKGRSLSSPAELAPFAALDGTRLIALQKLDADDLERADTPSGWKVSGLPFVLEHPGPGLDAGPDAFVDTAAIMKSLDLVVSVCTAPLHLAGALGVPTIALLKSVPDWRWGLRGERTPWYPRMRLERQAPGEGYGPVLARAAATAQALLDLPGADPTWPIAGRSSSSGRRSSTS